MCGHDVPRDGGHFGSLCVVGLFDLTTLLIGCSAFVGPYLVQSVDVLLQFCWVSPSSGSSCVDVSSGARSFVVLLDGCPVPMEPYLVWSLRRLAPSGPYDLRAKMVPVAPRQLSLAATGLSAPAHRPLAAAARGNPGWKRADKV